MKTITRIFYYLYRIFNTIRFLGFQNTLKIFFISKLKSSIMYLTLFRNKFYFRPKIDIGSYNRLTKSQYMIRGTVKQPIEVVIDAGSNIGSQAIRFINLNPKIKKMICVEPDTSSSELCYKNLKNYDAKIYNNALSGNSNNDLIVQKTINSEMSEIIEKKDNIIKSNNFHEIKTISINEIVKIENLKKIDFIKFDINGYEDDVFSKNLEWLKITNCIGFNNADINNTTNKIIKAFSSTVGNVKVYNIDQMIFLIRENFHWLPVKGFMSSRNIGYLEKDERY